MGERPAQRDDAFALGGNLGPVVGGRGVEVELALLSQHVRGHCHRALGGGPGHLHRPAGVRPGPAWRGHSTPEVDHALSIEVDAAGGAALAMFLEVDSERLPHRLETGRHRPPKLRLDHFAEKRTTDFSFRSWMPPPTKANSHIHLPGGTGAWLGDGVPPTSRGGRKLVPPIVTPLSWVPL